ncbi:hypothetical protein E2C01_064929 [Portunus trituberculatus]|uniref:Uncharacterized protein n=1 Tax=Portunus trituberculatus TaxID=210409 RepID=A0A5B7HM56_PORTR|nr:hypothetical protein [Portunus trituberculatus]
MTGWPGGTMNRLLVALVLGVVTGDEDAIGVWWLGATSWCPRGGSGTGGLGPFVRSGVPWYRDAALVASRVPLAPGSCAKSLGLGSARSLLRPGSPSEAALKHPRTQGHPRDQGGHTVRLTARPRRRLAAPTASLRRRAHRGPHASPTSHRRQPHAAQPPAPPTSPLLQGGGKASCRPHIPPLGLLARSRGWEIRWTPLQPRGAVRRGKSQGGAGRGSGSPDLGQRLSCIPGLAPSTGNPPHRPGGPHTPSSPQHR